MTSECNIEIVTVGTRKFPRYIIAAGAKSSPERQYWAGQKWISQSHLALLYADENLARQDLVAIGEAVR